MTWPKYVLLARYVLSAFICVSQIGKPKKPTTPGLACALLVVLAGLAALVVIA